MNHCEQPRLRMSALGVDQLLHIHRLAPFGFNTDDPGPCSLRHRGQSPPEYTVHADDRRIARLEHIDHRGFHPRGAGARDWNRHFVSASEHRTQLLTNLVHQPQKSGVQMADRWTRHREQDPRADFGWARPHQYTTRGLEGGITADH